MGTNQKTNLANSSNMGPLTQVSGFTFVVNPLTAMICTGSPFFTNVSLVASIHLPQKSFRRSHRSGKARSPFFPPSFLCRP
jgi:hypothetical protein